MASDQQAVSENIFDIEAEGPLPNGLQLLALEMRTHGGTGLAREVVENMLNSYLRCLNAIGCSSYLMPEECGLFGVKNSVRIRFDILAMPDVLQKWFQLDNGHYRLGKCLNISLMARNNDLEENDDLDDRLDHQPRQKSALQHRQVSMSGASLLDSFAHRFKKDSQNEDDGEGWHFREIYAPYSGHKPGDFAQWALSAQTTNRDLERFAILAEACEGQSHQISAALDRAETLEGGTPTSFLVSGLIPRGVVTLLLGNRKVGKSALALELAVAVAQREKQWAGFPINPGKGHAVYLLGEDTIEEAFARVKQMTGGETPPLLWLMRPSGLAEALDTLRDANVSLLVVDPARKYFTGDEDGSDAVSGFFTAIETFAMKKNAAAIVSHHLRKGAEPRNVSDVANYQRGSGVFLDRPRVTLALHRTGHETHLAIPILNNAPLHNFSQSAMFSGVRRLVRDEASFRHRCLDLASDQPKPERAANVDPVFAAASRIITSGERLTSTGKTGLHERKPPEIAGMARKAARTAVATLISHGRLSVDETGMLTLPPKDTSRETLADLIL
jgi:hypothetical protein